MLESPQSHGDTEDAQNTLPLSICRISDFGFRIFHPPPSQPQRHEGTKKSQSPPTRGKPQITQINADDFFRSDRDTFSSVTPRLQKTLSTAKLTQPPVVPTDHTDKHRCVHTHLSHVARFRPSDGNRHCSILLSETPWPSNGHGTTGPENRLESELSDRFPDPVVCALPNSKFKIQNSKFS